MTFDKDRQPIASSWGGLLRYGGLIDIRRRGDSAAMEGHNWRSQRRAKRGYRRAETDLVGLAQLGD